MNKLIFVDTSAWIMLLNKDEAYHQEAVALYNQRFKSTLVLTNLVIGETYTWLRKKASIEKALGFVKAVEKKHELNQIKVVYSGPDLEQQAVRWLEKYREHQFSYADAVSFCVMQSLGIKEAFTYDRHFLIAGFTVINGLD